MKRKYIPKKKRRDKRKKVISPTKAKPSITKYNRKKDKRKLEEEIENAN